LKQVSDSSVLKFHFIDRKMRHCDKSILGPLNDRHS
jgi:hypothetical protein